jgi:endonuclease/exonuclease/phosphatase family metal-dependent hydrolase
MDFIRAPGRKSAAALMSRWPIATTINHGLLRLDGPEKCCLEADLIEPGGQRWTIGVCHLHAHARETDEQMREKELPGLLDAFARHRAANHVHVLVGDFNSNSPHQQIDPDQLYPTSRKEWDENGGGFPRHVVQRMFDAGYGDAHHVCDSRFADTHGTFTTQHPGQRVDYIFTWGIERTRIKQAWIEYDRLAKYASDHFPIGVEIA